MCWISSLAATVFTLLTLPGCTAQPGVDYTVRLDRAVAGFECNLSTFVLDGEHACVFAHLAAHPVDLFQDDAQR